MSTPSPLTPIEQAAIPSAVALLQATQTFIDNMGTDPMQWTVKFPGALVALQGAVMLQAPLLANAEGAAISAQVNSTVAGWITKLKLAEKPAA